MTKQEKIIPMDDKLHPIGTLMYEDSREDNGSNDWKPHHNIWKVIAHREYQEYPDAPIKIACEVVIVRQEDL